LLIALLICRFGGGTTIYSRILDSHFSGSLERRRLINSIDRRVRFRVLFPDNSTILEYMM
jgi:hypothetical protein